MTAQEPSYCHGSNEVIDPTISHVQQHASYFVTAAGILGEAATTVMGHLAAVSGMRCQLLLILPLLSLDSAIAGPKP
jgi:hypothetical protein